MQSFVQASLYLDELRAFLLPQMALVMALCQFWMQVYCPPFLSSDRSRRILIPTGIVDWLGILNDHLSWSLSATSRAANAALFVDLFVH